MIKAAGEFESERACHQRWINGCGVLMQDLTPSRQPARIGLLAGLPRGRYPARPDRCNSGRRLTYVQARPNPYMERTSEDGDLSPHLDDLLLLMVHSEVSDSHFLQ